MTTFDKDGRMRTGFRPPSDETGRPLSHAEWIKRRVLKMLETQPPEEVRAWLISYRDAGPKDAPKFDAAMAAALALVPE